jgi:DnaK suppressor protein
MSDTAAARERLVVERSRVRRRLDAARERSSDACPADLADLAEVAVRRDAESDREDVLARRLAAIDRALERLDAGTYGRWARCGDPISPDRLDLLPAATTCVRHAEEPVMRR